MKRTVFLLAVSALLIPSGIHAMPITVQPAGTTTVLTTLTGSWASAPSVTAGGYAVFAPVGAEVWYGDAEYGLASNGSWSGFAWVGGFCFSGPCTATIDLGGLYSAVGGFMNYAPGVGGTPFIRALGADGTTVLESYDLPTTAPIITPGGVNAGAFRGVQRGTADIAYFQVSGGYLIMHDLTVGGGTPPVVPEPGSMLLLGTGLIGLGRAWRKRRS